MPELAANPVHEKKSPPLKLAGGIAIAVVLLILASLFPVKEYAISLLNAIEGLGIWGYVAFFALYVLFTVLFLPGFILTLGAGAIFGVVGGFLVISLGSTIGACFAFLLGRFFAREMIESKVSGNKKFAAIDKAVGKEGWKIVLLSRLTPIFPFNLINYAYGLTKVPFWHYAFASWIGMMPGTLLYVYIGLLSSDVALAAAGGGGDASAGRWIFNGVGLLATIIVTIYITKVAKRALDQVVRESEAGELKDSVSE